MSKFHDGSQTGRNGYELTRFSAKRCRALASDLLLLKTRRTMQLSLKENSFRALVERTAEEPQGQQYILFIAQDTQIGCGRVFDSPLTCMCTIAIEELTHQKERNKASIPKQPVLS